MMGMLVQLVLYSLGVQGWETLVFLVCSGRSEPGKGLPLMMRFCSSKSVQARASAARSIGLISGFNEST